MSGCPRNCAEATIKDIGLVAVEGGWQVRDRRRRGRARPRGRHARHRRAEAEAMRVAIDLPAVLPRERGVPGAHVRLRRARRPGRDPRGRDSTRGPGSPPPARALRAGQGRRARPVDRCHDRRPHRVPGPRRRSGARPRRPAAGRRARRTHCRRPLGRGGPGQRHPPPGGTHRHRGRHARRDLPHGVGLPRDRRRLPPPRWAAVGRAGRRRLRHLPPAQPAHRPHDGRGALGRHGRRRRAPVRERDGWLYLEVNR